MPFLGEPCETGFEWSTAEVVVDECGVDVERVADPECLEVRFEGVTMRMEMGPPWGTMMERGCVWTSGSIVATVRNASVMLDHLDGGW